VATSGGSTTGRTANGAPITTGALAVGATGARGAARPGSFITSDIATPTTMVLTMATMPIDARTAIVILRADHRSPVKNRIIGQPGGSAPGQAASTTEFDEA
jgi:hypothetical protein